MKGYTSTLNNEAYINRMVDMCEMCGVNINLESPKTIQDKLCWLNIYDVNPLKPICADKIRIREYCMDKIGKDICVPLIATYDKTSDIQWDTLPEKFAIKCNHGSGMNIIVKEKSILDIPNVERALNIWLSTDFTFKNGFESHYHGIERRILVEKYLDNNGTPDDYKFICFNGKPTFMQILNGRFTNNLSCNYYDMDFNFMDISRNDIRNNPTLKQDKPESFELMKEYATKLSQPFKFVRVDFYEIDGQPYLGELTFTPGAMLFKYVNPEDEIKIGNMLEI